MARHALAVLAVALVALTTGPGSGTAGAAARSGRAADPLRNEQYALGALHLPAAWTRSQGEGAVVAVVDTGVDLDHPDLVDHLLPGVDLIDGDDEPDDPNGHGTHVAGLVAAVGGNGIGITGAAPEAHLLPVRALRADGAGSARTLADGVDWAAAHGADVINLSVGGAGLAPALFENGPLSLSVRNAASRGVVVVTAAGNDATDEDAYRPTTPALVVNASGPSGAPAPFTTFGDPSALAAPGVDVVSTAPEGPSARWPTGTDGYEPMDGSSMSAALVSGVAALLVAEGLSAEEVRSVLWTTAQNPQDDPRLGLGLVDADAAVTAGRALHPLPIPEDEPDGRFAPWLAPFVVIAAAVVVPAAGLALVRRRARAAA